MVVGSWDVMTVDIAFFCVIDNGHRGKYYKFIVQEDMHAVLQFAVGVVVVDFVTAFLHWFEDNYLYYDHPWLRQISIENELHHFRPRTITYYSNWESSKSNIVAALLLCAAVRAFLTFEDYPVLFATLLLFGSSTNVYHKYTHQRDCERPRWVTRLMRTGVLVSRDIHVRHHTADAATADYGIVVAPLNTLYDKIGIWKAFERALRTCGVHTCKKRGTRAYPVEEQHEYDTDCPRPLTGEEVADYYRRLRAMYDTLPKCAAETAGGAYAVAASAATPTP